MGSVSTETPATWSPSPWWPTVVGYFVMCWMMWRAARAVRTSAAERQAKAGQWTALSASDAKYPGTFAIVVITALVLLHTMTAHPWPQALHRPSRIGLVGVNLGSVAYAACQLLLRTRESKCAVSGASHATSLGLGLASKAHEANASTLNYATMMVTEWRYALRLLAVFSPIMLGSQIILWFYPPPWNDRVSRLLFGRLLPSSH